MKIGYEVQELNTDKRTVYRTVIHLIVPGAAEGYIAIGDAMEFKEEESLDRAKKFAFHWLQTKLETAEKID